MSVWLTGQRTSQVQRKGRYLPASVAHPGKMLPEIARQAIAAYTTAGDLVLDPMCGIGTTLVEAAHLGRDAIGIEFEDRWATLARRNIVHAKTQGATGTAAVIRGDARELKAVIQRRYVRAVALVLTSPPYGPSLHGQVHARPGGGVAKSDDRYSRDPNNLAHVGTTRLVDAMAEIAQAAAAVLRPGGILAMTVRPYWSRGSLVDLPGLLTTAVIDRTTLALFERNVVLLAAVRGEALVPRASFFQLGQVRKARARGLPRHLLAHEDLLVFRLPETPVGHRAAAESLDIDDGFEEAV